jgi:hypothetical protein
MSVVRLLALLVLGLVATRWALARPWVPEIDPFRLDAGIRRCEGGL